MHPSRSASPFCATQSATNASQSSALWVSVAQSPPSQNASGLPPVPPPPAVPPLPAVPPSGRTSVVVTTNHCDRAHQHSHHKQSCQRHLTLRSRGREYTTALRDELAQRTWVGALLLRIFCVRRMGGDAHSSSISQVRTSSRAIRLCRSWGSASIAESIDFNRLKIDALVRCEAASNGFVNRRSLVRIQSVAL